jgi:integrase
VVSGREFTESFRTKTLADNFRSELVQATNAGEAFDTDTGRPASTARARTTTTWYQHARAYIAMKWPALAANSRRSTVEALVSLTPALVRASRGHRPPEPTLLRQALYLYAFNPRRTPAVWPAEHAAALAWLEKASVPVAELDSPATVRRVLDTLCLRLDGQPAAASTVARKRAVFHNVAGYAVECGLLGSNPVGRIQWHAPAVAEAIDRRVVANPTQVASLLTALASLGKRAQPMVAYFGCLYYAGTRPAEAADLRAADCQLPGRCLDCDTLLPDLTTITPTRRCRHEKTEPAWGRITLAETNPQAGSHWTDDGSPYQRRGLKHRARTATRTVPIPPRLVALLCEHVQRHDAAADGRLFYGLHGGPLAQSVYQRWWKLARRRALTPAQVASPLARRPYDLRHAAASLWLNSGVPATEVARRLGHSVAVLLRIYANCIDGGDDTNNQRIEDALT